MIDVEFQERVQSLLDEQVFSYSRLKLFEECPFRWYLKYVEKTEEEEALPLMLGKAVHKAIEEKLIGKSDKDALIEGWKEVEYYPFDLIEYEALFRRANVVRGSGTDSDVDVEYHFTLPLDGTNSPKVQGYIDLVRQIFGSYEFTDWKTNRVKYEPTDNMQLALYAWAVSKIYNVPEVTGTLFFLRFYKDNAKTKTFSEIEMEYARKWAFQLAKEINTSLEGFFVALQPFESCFPATPNSGCANCPFADKCLVSYPNISKGVFYGE